MFKLQGFHLVQSSFFKSKKLLRINQKQIEKCKSKNKNAMEYNANFNDNITFTEKYLKICTSDIESSK